MTRKITTAAELDALPVGSVVLGEDPTEGGGVFGADHPGVSRRPLGERIFPRWDPDARWNVDGRHYYGATETVLAVLGGEATVIHDPSVPAPAPSVVPESAVEAVARALSDDWNPGRDPVLTAMFRDYAHTALTAALPLLTAAPSATRDEVARAIRSVTDRWDEPLDEVHDVPLVADALLARFTITPKEDR